MYSAMPVVYVGPYPCAVVMHLSSSEVVTCETSAGVVGTYIVAVAVEDDSASYYSYTYTDSYTPTFKAAFPYAGPPGTAVTLYGDNTWNLQNIDCVAKTYGDVDCIGSITFGDYLCRQDPSTVGGGITFVNGDNSALRYGYSLYLINCTLPTPDSSNSQPALGTAGNLNVSLHFEASMRGGKPRTLISSYHYTANGTPYQFQLYPEVMAVTPAVGSVAGGTLLNISGRGFPDLGMGLGDTVNVSIGGVPCAVVNSTFDTIFCVTGPKPASAALPVAGLYAGMRGVEYELYNVSRNVGYDEAWKLNNTILLNNTAGTGSYKTVLTSAMEGLHYAMTYHCSLMKAFYIAPRTSNYTFYMQADDWGQLKGTWMQDNGVALTSNLVTLNYWTSIDQFFSRPEQKAATPVALKAGQAILLQASHCNGPSVGVAQIAVRVEVPAPQPNSIAEKQVIYARAILVQRSVAFKYMYGAGAASTVYNINVTSSNELQLNSTALGLQLTISSKSGEKVVVLPLFATGREMAALVEAQFGGKFSLGSNGTSFGVYKTRIPGLLTVQVGIDTTLAGSLGFAIDLAQLVVIPPAAPFTSSPCGNVSYASPSPSAMDVSAATAGMVVLLEKARPVPAVTPGGNFQLRLASRTDTAIPLTYDTNGTTMFIAVRNLTSYYSPTTWNLASVQREGAYLARVWNVSFDISLFNNVPQLIMEPYTGTPPGVTLDVEVREANPPATGSFSVGYGSLCGSVDISLKDAAETVRIKLASLPGMAAPQTVAISGGPTSGYTYTVTFDPIGNPGDQPELRVTDISSLNGIGPAVSVTTNLNGSTDAFYGPIPTEFLRLAVAQPGTIDVRVNGVPSACADPSGICGFQYSDAATPRITSVSPSVLQFVGVSKLPLTIIGSGFSNISGVVVQVGTAVCNVTSATVTQITCDVPDTAPAGVRLVTVNVAGLGFASGASNITLETLYVTGSAPATLVINREGRSIMNFTGKGFDNVRCANNEMLIDGAACGILACGANFLTVVYPGNEGADVTAASVTAQVYENNAQIDTDTPTGIKVQISGGAPLITGLNPARMPSSGGNISVAFSGFAASQVTSVFLVPYISSLFNFTAASGAYQQRVACSGITALALAGDSVSCVAPPMRNGRYHTLVVMSSGLQLISTDTILFELFITRVLPNLGSIGGGTLVTITGSGFHPNVSANAVFMTVPVSTTFLNGVVECVTQSVTSTTLTCRTLPSMAANADADDPKALNVMPIATQPRPVSVVLCDPSYTTTILRGYCWSLDETPRASCAAADPADCSFGYATDLTPQVMNMHPTDGYFGTRLALEGAHMDDIAIVEFLQNDVVMGLGTGVGASGDASCVVPDLPPGVYKVQPKKANGEMSVDPYGKGVFTYRPTIKALDSNVGSLAGGLVLGVSVGGAGLIDGISNNEVAIAGVPCPVLSLDNRTRLTCRAPGINGYVYAEYWNLVANTYSMPDIITFDHPLVSRLEKGINFAWKASSPLIGTINPDFFAARYTFHYQISQTESATFVLESDDASRLYIDDEYVGSRGTLLNVVLMPGIHKIVVTYAEYSGWASLKLSVGYTYTNGTRTTPAVVEWQKVTPMAPGTVLPVQIKVNGIASWSHCTGAVKVLQLPGQPDLPYEPSLVTIPEGTCGYVYTTHRTPALLPLNPSLSGITLPTFNGPMTSMCIWGNFLVNDTTKISITVANQSCNIINATSMAPNGNVGNITCIAPAVPAGTWPVSIMVDGLGLTRPTPTAAADLPIVTYAVKVNSYNNPVVTNPNSKCQFSMFGGGTFNISGYGFVRGLVDKNLALNMTAAWENGTVYTTNLCSTGSFNLPPCQAANSSRMSLVPLGCDGPTAVFQMTRAWVPNPEAYAANNSINAIYLRYKPRIYNITSNNTLFSTSGAAENLYFCGGRTPALSAVSPTNPAPDAGATLSLTWYMSGVGTNNGTITATPPGSPSNATVEFEVGPTVLRCANPVVATATIGPSTYLETISCTMPAYMPAANYALWLCIQPFGCGLVPSYSVPLIVSATSVTTGSSAGGVSVIITGKGFDTNNTLVSARFGSSTCKITSSTGTLVTCVTGPLDSKPAGNVTWPLSITPTRGASEVTYSSFTFTFDPALEASLSSIVPSRGSTEGGTPVTITGSGFRTGIVTTVTVGETPCSSVVVVNSTTITCTTGKPPNDVLRVPLPVLMNQQGRGNARGAVQYQYIDVWSRNSTWNGGPLPGYEDSVVIPYGATVLLDMSPPKLYTLVLMGNLIFDDTLDYINLQAHYIIVKGGNFTIGSAEKPFPGRANITMHGLPWSKDLPQYGAKALAVRTGVVTFYGKPKIPHYTKLNRTADINDTSIVLNGAVNWEVGDRIVIASSSLLPWENDEATITALDNTTVPGCTLVALDTPLQYTHLGEIHRQTGVAEGLDMRAEVAVLTRNIVLQGDYTSAKYQYGVQVMVNTPSYLPTGLVRFDNIEITQSGQAFRLGRYSMHWHLLGDVAWQTWVRGCAIHHTYNRAITVHGTHRAIIQNVTAYHTMGHTFFLEDGIESMNLIENTISIYAKVSDALLNTDTTPAAFWMTNPNNTLRNCVGSGSHGYAFWYRMLDHPDGPSATTTICPKFTPLLEFTNNTAHSNMFYGLRIHPEYYPRNTPCTGFSGYFQQEPAAFSGLVAYKNGVKGAVASQMGLVQFTNMIVGDNGAGPKQHSISGKDHGGQLEITWVMDDRNRVDVKLNEMAGFTNATIFGRTSTGKRGSAGQLYSCRRIAGVITQSPVTGDAKHSALMSMTNLTFVDYVGNDTDSCNYYSAIEACGKCKTYQGGSTSFTANISFVNSDGSKPVISLWSWGHQGIYLDTDGTLLNAKNLEASDLPPPGTNWTFGPGATWHSAIENDLVKDPADCVFLNSTRATNNGAYCNPALSFRRVMLHNHGPEALKYKSLNVVSQASNRTSVVHYSGYNDDGYQFTTAVNRDYWLTWDMVWYRLDPEYYTIHKMDMMNSSDYVFYSSKYLQPKDHFTVNNTMINRTDVPPALPTTAHGDFFYNKTFVLNSWWWSNRTYNDTKFTMYVAGRTDSYLNVQSYACPDEGCSNVPDAVVDVRNGTLYWSNISTWTSSEVNNFRKPIAGDNVTIPYGWDLVIDESPPPLSVLWVQGSLRFDATRDINLTATYILVVRDGSLSAGSPLAPHPTKATILLQGDRQTPDYAIDNNLNLGSKVLAALLGGTINLYGRVAKQRWIRLGARAAPGDTVITVSNPDHDWRVGDRIVIAATSYNWKQSELRYITAILNNGSKLQLNAPLESPHSAVLKAYPRGPTVDMRAEVGLASSNVLITAIDGPATHAYKGEMLGAHVTVSGNSTLRLDSIAMEYCGQAGLSNHSCIFFDRLKPVTRSVFENSTNTTIRVTSRNPSFLSRSSLLWGLQTNVRTGGPANETEAVSITENVMYEAFEAHSVDVQTIGNTIRGNLVMGTIKDMAGQSAFDTSMPSSFAITYASNYVTDNVAAGGERYGFTYNGLPCAFNFTAGSFRNNTAHSYLAGLWLRSSNESEPGVCTALRNFTTYLNWDFGIISTRGIFTDIVFENVNVLDNKHSGVTLLRAGELTEPAGIWWYGGLIAGQSSDDVCAVCTRMADPGCHKKLSQQSYIQSDPFTPAVGLQSAQFAINFYPGPEIKPWDKSRSYALVHGMFNISGVTIADFLGPAGCGGAQVGTYALANHPLAPETFYPHFFSDMNVVNVASGPAQGLFHHTAPLDFWRGELCGEANYTREDGSVIQLTCAGSRHIHWRDLDGSLTGTIGTTEGLYASGQRVFPMDQGTPILPGPCTYSSVTGSYSCEKGSTEFLLDARIKPNPIPTDGIWGDPQMLVLESRDKDSADRNFGPVFFNVSGSIDLVTVQMDHGCCFTYKCQKRLSTFATYVPTGQTVYINFTGTPAQIFRIWFPYADPDKEVVLVINYLYTLNRRFVMMPEGVLPGISGRMTPEVAPPVIGDGKDHGAYYWDQNNTLMYVKLKGGKHLEVRTESAVQISQKFALTVDQFWDIQELFLTNLASAMNIARERLFIVKVVAGSTIATFGVASPPQPVSELVIPAGLDEGDPLPIPPPPEPAPVLTEYDKAHLAAMGTSAPKNITLVELIVLRQLWAMFDSYTAVVNSTASVMNITVLSVPTAYIPPIRATDEAAAASNGTINNGTTSNTPSSSPPPAGVVVPIDNSGVIDSGSGGTSSDGGGGGSSGGTFTSSTGSDKDRKAAPIGAIIGGAVAGGLIAAAVMLAVLVVQRRKAKRLRSVMPPGKQADELAAEQGAATASADSPVRHGSGSQVIQGVVREAFTVASPTGAPASRRPSMVTAEQDAERLTELTSPRSAACMSGSHSLAAGYVAPSDPEVIRPLVSTNKQPHSSMPVLVPTFPLGSPAASGGLSAAAAAEDEPCRRRSASSVTKTPAQLQRADSSQSRYSAPGEWDGGMETLERAALGCRVSRSVTEAGGVAGAGSRPGSGRPAFAPLPCVGVEIAPAAAQELELAREPQAGADDTPAGDTVTPVSRTLETQESFVPRPKSRATGSRPGSGGAHCAAAGPEEERMAGPGHGSHVGVGVAGATELAPMAPSEEVRRRTSSPPQPTMMLPGGMMEFAASPSLIRSEVAALMIAAAGSNDQGWTEGGEDAANMHQQGQQRQQGHGSPQAARTPAGLRSDSMRWQGSDLE